MNKLEKTMNALKKALKFYTNEDLYKYEVSYDMAELSYGEILFDEGEKARNALNSGTLQDYVKALKFYADDDNYDYDVSYDMAELIMHGNILKDAGNVAKTALKLNINTLQVDQLNQFRKLLKNVSDF